MKTQIFDSYADFLNREDTKINGVSKRFAEDNPNYKLENKTNEGCWNCSECSDCSDCSRCSGCFDCSGCFGCSDCSHCSSCFGCSDCSHCSDCFGCSDCSSCFGCSRCSRCSDCSGASDQKGDYKNAFGEIPKVENIHQKILEAVEGGKFLAMGDWHTCDTTHCRAGWAIHLAGDAGYALEKATNPVFAGIQIFKASSDIKVSPVRFFEDNEKGLEDIKRCAELEKKQS